MTSTPAASKINRPLRVGFDLDGVILYNPIRIYRPFVAAFKKAVLKKKKIKFYVPKSPREQWLFRQFHKSSIFVAPGLDIVRQLVAEKKISAYLITARFDYLKPDLDRWLDKINAHEYFTLCCHNEHNEQPHLFKARKLQELDLDIFVEDNWDIVHYLSTLKTQKKLNTTVYWIYNLFDRRIVYPHKFPYLKKAVEHIQTLKKT